MIVTIKKYPELGRLRVVADVRKDLAPCAKCVLRSKTDVRMCGEGQAPKSCVTGNYRFEAIK